MRRHASHIASLALSVALLLPAATPAAAVENTNRATDADPWGPCRDAAGSTYGHYNCDGMPDQAWLEKSNAELGSQTMPGNWYDLESPADLSSRPFVEYLYVSNEAGSATGIVYGGTVSTFPMGAAAGSLGVVITPFNLCDKDRTPTPQTTNCYATPNRVGITLAYRKGDGQVGYNFSRPNNGQNPGTDVTLRDNDGNPIVIDENTEITIIINLNTIGKTLRWTWMNGIPSYWRATDLGTDAATIQVTAKLAKMPIIDTDGSFSANQSCTQVPISSCNVTQSNADWLGLQMVLSLDTTMSEAMTGALFATEGAIMGSVEVGSDATTGLPLIKYAAASSHLTATGETRLGKMHAYVPASALVQQLGVPAFTDTTAVPAAATPAQVFTTLREGTCAAGCSAGTTTFTELNQLENDFNGIRVDIDGLTFSAPKMQVKAKSGALKAPTARLTGSTYKITVASGSTSSSAGTANGICKSKGCTVKLYKAPTSLLSSTLTYIGAKTSAKGSNINLSFSVTRKTTGSTAGRVQRGTRYIVVVTRKDTGALVSSAPVVLP